MLIFRVNVRSSKKFCNFVPIITKLQILRFSREIDSQNLMVYALFNWGMIK